MKFCTKCGTQCDDMANCCHKCGAPFVSAAPMGAQQAAPMGAPMGAPMVAPMPYVDPHDHTAEFDPKDISDNKVVAMLCYLLGTIGVIIACLLSTDSKYVKFHVRACLKITVVEAILLFVNIIPFLGWLVWGVCTIICGVVRIIAFFQICSGKAKDPAIIGNLGFLK